MSNCNNLRLLNTRSVLQHPRCGSPLCRPVAAVVVTLFSIFELASLSSWAIAVLARIAAFSTSRCAQRASRSRSHLVLVAARRLGLAVASVLKSSAVDTIRAPEQ